MSTEEPPHIDLSDEIVNNDKKLDGDIKLKPYGSQPSQHLGKVADLTDEPATETPEFPKVTIREYDSRPHEDKARRMIAYILLLLLTLVTLGAMGLFIMPGTDKNALKDLLNQILGPLVALVSAATGFYFATKR